MRLSNRNSADPWCEYPGTVNRPKPINRHDTERGLVGQ
jgi:hypothetical protein